MKHWSKWLEFIRTAVNKIENSCSNSVCFPVFNSEKSVPEGCLLTRSPLFLKVANKFKTKQLKNTQNPQQI